MKQYGFLQTSSPVNVVDTKQRLAVPQDPLKNYKILFMGPEGSNIQEKIFGTSLVDRKLWRILFSRNEYGLRPLHFAVLDYFCEKYNLALTVTHHENKLIDELTSSGQYFYESILHGNWKHTNSIP